MAVRIKLALLIAVAAVGLFFAFNTAKADDKKDAPKCVTCAEVKVVIAAAHCEKCKAADPKCDHCTDAQKKLSDKFACKACEKDVCDDCKTAAKDIEAAKTDADKFAAAKKFMVAHTYCCDNCKAAGEDKAAKCKGCKTARANIEKIEMPKS